MPPFHRRDFLGTSARGLTAAALASGSTLLANHELPKPADALPATAPIPELAGLFLTWQRDPTTTMTIQWVGPDLPPEMFPVYYLPAGGKNWDVAATFSKPFTGTDLKVYRTELTGLTPGTDYTFRIGHHAAAFKFRTMPATATDIITFVSGGDSGVNTHAVNTNILAARQNPYFALIGGDLAYDNGTSPRTFLSFLQNYSKHMVDGRGRLVPMLACIGNHEVRTGYNGKRSDSPSFLSVFDGLFHETTYAALDFGDYLSLVLLDTGHIAPISGEQTQWLAHTLVEREQVPHLIVANHVPAYPSFRSPDGTNGTGEGNRVHWSPLFERHGVDAVLEHHDHTFKRTHPLIGGHKDRFGVPYLGDGSWGQLRPPVSPEKRPYLANVSQAYHMTVHRLEGENRFHVALEENGRVADVTGSFGKRPAKRG
jgi:hypothetical protein